jgi:hypothetical protein
MKYPLPCRLTCCPTYVISCERCGQHARSENIKVVWRCPPYWRSEQASEVAEVKAIEPIKCFDIFVQIAAVAATDTDVKCSILASCLRSCEGIISQIQKLKQIPV